MPITPAEQQASNQRAQVLLLVFLAAAVLYVGSFGPYLSFAVRHPQAAFAWRRLYRPLPKVWRSYLMRLWVHVDPETAHIFRVPL